MVRKHLVYRRVVKAIITISIITTLVLSFTACSSPETTTPTTTSPTTTAPPTTVEPITLIFSIHDPESGSWAEIFKPFFAEIEERTNGGIIIEEHWSGELAGFFESYPTVADGTVDITQTQMQMYPNLFPMEDITALWSSDVQCWARSQQWQEYFDTTPVLQQAFTDNNVKLLFRTSTWPCYATMIEGSGIYSYEDFEGKKFLTTGKYDSLKWEALGMVPLSMMPDETFMNLQTGVCDGAYFNIPALWDFGLTEVIKHISTANFAGGVFNCVMNLDTWNSLSPEYQQIIMEAAASAPARQDAAQWRLHDEFLDKAINELGMEYIELTPGDRARIDESVIPIREQWVQEMEDLGIPGQEMMDNMLMLEAKYAGDEYKP